MGQRLNGRSAVITGAGRGIGRSIALAFAREGADLVLNDRDASAELDDVAELCRAEGRQVGTAPADVSTQEGSDEVVGRALDSLRQIDVWVNNAGILTQSRIQDMTVEQWDEMLAVNLRSVFLCTRAVVPHMIERGSGRLISMASQLGQKGGVELAHYAAAKAGIIGFTKSLARELGEHGITANCIAPGPIETDMVAGISDAWKQEKKRELPLGRFGSPEEVAATAVFLAASPDGDLYTGQTLGPNSGDVMQ